MKIKFICLIYLVSSLYIFNLSVQESYAQYSERHSDYYEGVLLDTVRAGRFDMGKMWTFDNPPLDYFEEAYSFIPTKEWLDNVRMSALRFGSWCSASFVSEDGLIMTNHHCADGNVTQVTREGEDLHATGFYAVTLKDEREVPGLYVDQLVQIIDVTQEIKDAENQGKDDEEKQSLKKKKIREIEQKFRKDLNLNCSVVEFYNGGEYSLYAYKRYSDVRLVFAPEENIGFFGGDPDNFTYPRYDLDCSFFRVYDENGKPLKSEHFFKWSPNGAKVGEPIFVVGNPASTDRLNTVAQLEFDRDFQYRLISSYMTGVLNIYYELMEAFPERKSEFYSEVMNFANSQKSIEGSYKGLNNPILLERKKDFEWKFKQAVNSNPELNSKYGNLWDEISNIKKEQAKIFPEYSAYNVNPYSNSIYLNTAYEIYNEIKSKDEINVSEVFDLYPEDFDKEFEDRMLELEIKMLKELLGADNELMQELVGDRTGKDAVKYLLNNSALKSKEDLEALAKKGKSEMLNSDPFIKYISKTQDKFNELEEQYRELRSKERKLTDKLGQALFDVYGNTIPPDATFTLRISDGVIKPYDYNGTVTPTKTTFYGMYDRYYSFNKEFPWTLPDRWINPPPEFDLETPLNFVSTNDISGGNSGSPVINQYGEIIGVAFDGNIESLSGDFIYTSETGRTVSVDSEGMMEAIRDLYKATRLSEELKNGKMVSGN
ncbi:S46 family peptidase [Bacteroidota bacterium]